MDVHSPSAATPTQWNIAGQIFNTGANTVIFGNPQVGDWVSFEGHLLADGSRFADRIVLLNHSPENQFGSSVRWSPSAQRPGLFQAGWCRLTIRP